MLERFFRYTQRNSSSGTEVRAGVTTFLAMSYIIAVNPSLLAAAGVSAEAAVTSTCFAAGVMTILMGVCTNRPLACASGMGINAVVAFSLTAASGGDWRVAMGVIFLEGIIITGLVLCGLREAIMDAVPISLRRAIAVGLGIFIALLGLINGGIVVNNESTLIGFGSVYSPQFMVGALSVLVTFVLFVFHVRGALLIGILIASLAGIPLGVTAIPQGILQLPNFTTFGAPFQTAQDGSGMAILKVFVSPTLLVFVFSIMLSDFFDTMGTVVAVAKQGDFLDRDGNVEDIRSILLIDSIAAALGGFVGSSSCTTFMESASGAADGGRTGLTSVVCGCLFLVAAFFSPVIAVVSSAATCGALVLVGYLMMSVVADIDFDKPLDGISAFVTIIGIPLTYSISTGIGLGFIVYSLIAVCTGHMKKIKPLTWIVDIAFIISFLVA
ncbi:Xanthine/uracil/vitamin C permease [Coriobacterium glomerans PW2]|uniref:Xanthine/uracil/vitamin C permease n=1 Tax=Coriobacterium glomerans (strain ATCC 49209 / DSM 20642 / JCM 10262 / PW2) TaxID=700015 RepID=F2N7W7_CORGP|nr:NCS2 family permease [Coriobacterium glomerans]AEB07076.1 Xanthine/uracil/vitamin C permease [Coriobacterium glomerans PW2]